MTYSEQSFSSVLWPSPRPLEFSAWHGHIAFAHWIVSVSTPGLIVELGTHNGSSYFAFCNAVSRLRLSCLCRAVDTWEGDAHSGHYGEDVYESVRYCNEQHYSLFSKLLRMTFDQALEEVCDQTVDLLHIDGLHTYEAVKHDFEIWLPKLSDRGVVLFHDINVRAQDFGVWKLWGDLCKIYPNFAFKHSAGLGVLAVGRNVANDILDLCKLSENGEADAARAAFEQLSVLAQTKGVREPLSIPRAAACRAAGVNIARNCSTMQSSFLGDPGLKSSGPVGGEITGRFGFHTQHEREPWWTVDLGHERKITAAVLYNRMDGECIARSRNIRVLGSADNEGWSVLYEHDGKVFGGIDNNPLVIHFDDVRVRYIKLQLRGREFFHLDEVEIYADASVGDVGVDIVGAAIESGDCEPPFSKVEEIVRSGHGPSRSRVS